MPSRLAISETPVFLHGHYKRLMDAVKDDVFRFAFIITAIFY